MYLPALVAGAFFLGWAHTHTDEIPVVLGFVIIAVALIGALFPKHWLATWLTLGAVLFATELLVHFAVVKAPWASPGGMPWPALVAYIPAALGTGAGAAAGRALRA